MKTNYFIALCAAPALVLTVNAEEESKIDQFGELMGVSFEIAGKYIDILDGVKEKTVTPAEAAPLVEKLADTMAQIKTAVQALVTSMSPEEQAELGKQLADPELVKVLAETEKAMKDVKAALIEVKYFDSAELKVACEKFDAASE